MTCQHLVCASCAQPVAEGRCSVCRASRAELHSHGMSGQTLALLLTLLALLVVLAAHLGTR